MAAAPIPRGGQELPEPGNYDSDLDRSFAPQDRGQYGSALFGERMRR
jgi:hypothetical protein